MAEQKVVTMILTVDLQCCKCYKKVKKVLCKFPQIREQVFDEKQGIVTIKVVCCDPEKLRDKLCCKGGGCIKSIEIVEPPPPKTPPKTPSCLLPPTCVPVGICCGPCYEGRPGGPCYKGYGRPPICYDGYYGWAVYDSYRGCRPCHVSRCDQYFSDENPHACTVM